MVPQDAGIKVPVVDPDQTTAALADGIRELARSAETRQRMGEAGWKYAQGLGWAERAEQVSRWYTEIVEKQQVRATSVTVRRLAAYESNAAD